MACLYLAAKVEETPRRANDFINCDHYVRSKEDSLNVKQIRSTTPEKDADLFVLSDSQLQHHRQTLLSYERILLQALCFDLAVEHPYHSVLKSMHLLFHGRAREVAQVAWNFVNDSYVRSSLCLEFSPEDIAVGVIHVAARYCKVKINWPLEKHPLPSTPSSINTSSHEREHVSNRPWFDYPPFQIPKERLAFIEAAIIGMYSSSSIAIEDVVKRHIERAREREHEKKSGKRKESSLDRESQSNAILVKDDSKEKVVSPIEKSSKILTSSTNSSKAPMITTLKESLNLTATSIQQSSSSRLLLLQTATQSHENVTCHDVEEGEIIDMDESA